MIMLLELVDRWTRQVVAEVVVRRDTVELRVGDHLVGIADRDYLRDWLRHPNGCFAYDDVAWSVTGDGVALMVEDRVPMWPLADHQLYDLRAVV